MPFVNAQTGQLTDGETLPPAGPQPTDMASQRPYSPQAAIGGGFLQTNPVAQGFAFAQREVDRPNFEPKPGFNPLIMSDLHGYEDAAQFFASAVSPDDVSYRKRQIDALRVDAMRLDNSGGYADFGRMAGALLSPDQLVGFGELTALGRAGKITMRGEALRMAGTTIAVSGAENYAMDLGDPLRPAGSTLEDMVSQTISNTFFGAVRGYTAPRAAAVRKWAEQNKIVDPLPNPTDGSFWRSGDGSYKPPVDAVAPAPVRNPYSPSPLTPEMDTIIKTAQANHPNLPAGYLETVIRIETRGGRNIINPKNPLVHGPFQLAEGTAAELGVKDSLDPAQSAEGAAKLAERNAIEFKRVMGRDPTAGELYLAHQQGATGATQLLQHPDDFAIDTMRNYYVAAGKDATTANTLAYKSILDNGGTLADTGKSFADRWTKQYDRTAQDNIGAVPVMMGGSAGATTSPASVQTGGLTLTAAQRLSNEGLKSAFGLETLGWNPIVRGLASASETMRVAVGQLVDISGFQLKNFAGIASDIPVWGRYRLLRADYGEALRATDAAFTAHVQRLATEAGVDGPKGIIQNAKSHLMGTEYSPRKADFMREVGDAKAHLGTPDEARFSPEAVQAAKVWDEKIYKPIADLAHENGLFAHGPKRELEDVEAQIKNASLTNLSAADIAKLKLRRDELKDLVAHYTETNPYKPGYLNRLWNHEAVVQRAQHLEQIIKTYYPALKPDAIKKIIEKLAKDTPFMPLGPDEIGHAAASHERGLDKIPHQVLADEGFIERDITTAGGAYTRTMGVDAHMAKTFAGDIDLQDVIAKIEAEHGKEIAAAADPAAKTKAEGALKNDLEDIRGLRDLVRGTYGLAKDPHGLMSRGIRLAKNFNVLTQLTGFVSALPDLARVPMTEGFNKAFGQSFRAFIQRGEAFKLGREEARLAGQALDVATGLRAATMADITDSFATSSKVERLIQHATHGRFLVDGMSHWTDAIKTIASMTIGTRMINDIHALAAGTLSEIGRAKLARAYIDKPMAERIAKELQAHQLEHEDLRFANTERWTDREAADTFKAGLGKDIDIAIVTTSPGEKPLWMSTEWGGLLSQYKSYGMGATMRIMLPHLQAPDRNFMLGLVALVGLGAMADMMQTNRRGQSYQNKAPGQKLTDAVDRSGALGYFMDVNNIAEGMTGIGMRSILGGTPRGSTLSAIGGPTVSSVMDGLAAAGGAPNDPRTAQAQRRILPLGRVWQFDPMFDLIAGT